MLQLRIIGMSPPSGTVEFGDWCTSAFVHGHAGLGRFAYDNDEGSMYAYRLFGFFDAYNRHLAKKYINSWLVLPRALAPLLKTTWTALAEMLGARVFDAMDDGTLHRQGPESGGVEQLLLSGRIPFIENVHNYGADEYPHANRDITFWIDAELCRRFRPQLANGTSGHALAEVNVVAQFRETEDPRNLNDHFYMELFLPDPVEIPPCVEQQLAFGHFAQEGFADDLRLPRYEAVGMQRAEEVIENTLPMNYGEPSGGESRASLYQFLAEVNIGETFQHGLWDQALPWHRRDPTSRLPEVDASETWQQKVDWLTERALMPFGAQRCVGLAGSYRPRRMPIAGSLMWSLLLHGQRLVILWRNMAPGSKAISTIQDAGDFLVIPPGCHYAWYNIRSCISDEGHFYASKLLPTFEFRDKLFPGTLDLLLESQSTDLDTERFSDAISYFLLVKVMLSTLHEHRRHNSVLDSFIGVLCMPVFAYIPRNRHDRLNSKSLQTCANILAWTSSFATLALHRCIQARRGIRLDVEGDSSALMDASEDAVEGEEDHSEDPLVATHVSDTVPQGDQQKGLDEPADTSGGTRREEQVEEDLASDPATPKTTPGNLLNEMSESQEADILAAEVQGLGSGDWQLAHAATASPLVLSPSSEQS